MGEDVVPVDGSFHISRVQPPVFRPADGLFRGKMTALVGELPQPRQQSPPGALLNGIAVAEAQDEDRAVFLLFRLFGSFTGSSCQRP